MIQRDLRRGLSLGLLLTAVSIAPAPPEEADRRSALAQARYKAALRQFEETWVYYKQSRTNTFPVYYWSRLVLDSQRELDRSPAGQRAALEAHRERMLRMEALVLRVRRLGFSFSTDVGATEYYRLEADYWLEGEKGK
jgi:hypothetical protein